MLEFPRTIGIIGGAGVAASAELVSRIERKVTSMGAFRDAQHPELLLFHATRTPSRSMYLEGRGESFVPGYVDAASRLKAAGASFVVMCCNTAHYGRDAIETEAAIPVIDLITESIRKALAISSRISRIGLLCSDGTRLGRVYEIAASSIDPRIEIVYPEPVFQAKVTEGICNIKKGFHRTHAITASERPAVLFRTAASNLIDKGVDVIVLGCTEIPLDFDCTGLQTPFIDTIEVLADTCIAAASARYTHEGPVAA